MGEGRAKAVSESTTARLSLYLRCLNLLDRAGVGTISSKDLAEQFNLNSALIRKDLAYFGEFGVRGVGYKVKELREQLVHILGLDRDLRVVIIGAGNLGLALADYRGFNQEGCHIVALFDAAPLKVGSRSRGGVPVHHIDALERIVQEESVNIAVLAIPSGEAQSVLDWVKKCGIRAVLNFVPDRLQVDGLFIRDVDLKIQLEGLAFHLAHLEESQKPPGL